MKDNFMDLVAQAKNMRAILYLKSEDENFIKFVTKYNRRRSVGLPEFIDAKGKCFVKLEVPKKVEKFYEKLEESEKVVLLSMMFIAPILTMPSYIKDFEEYEIALIMAKEELDIKEGLRHLRISEYSMLDYRLSNENEIEKYVANDLRRFWRIKGDKTKVGSYVVINIPKNLKEFARGYAIEIGVKIQG